MCYNIVHATAGALPVITTEAEVAQETEKPILPWSPVESYDGWLYIKI